jgi:CDP-paratose 2-epimerase
MNIIITGGAGFVGSHAAEYFAARKHRVVIIDNLMRSHIFGSKSKSVEYNWEYLKTLKGIVAEKQDVRDEAAMNKIFKREKPDVVIHTAGQPGVRFSLEDPMADFTINATGTMVVLEAMRAVNPKGKFIFTSTNKVYGDRVNDLPIKSSKLRYGFKTSKGIDENFGVDLTGHTPYGVSKLAADLYVQDYAYAHGLNSTVFRMSCIYGTRQFGFEDQGWLAWFTIKCLQNNPVTIFGDGKQIRDVLWVGDLVAAFDAYIQSGKKLSGEVFNIGGGNANTLSLLELVDHLRNITQKPLKVKFEDWRKFDQKVYVSDISKAAKVLGWKPKIEVSEGIKRLVTWVNANPKLFKL